LPLYNQDDDANQAESVKQLKNEIKTAQGLLFVTAEYNRSIPGVLKNAIDHASRPYGQNVWEGKPAGVLGASIGVIGTALAQQHLRNVLAYLNVPTLGQPEAFIYVKDAVTGDSLNHVNEAVHRNGKIKWIHVRHEETAAFAAWAEALLNGLACCVGCSGPGQVYLPNGLYDAY
jgi:NAD(P)H-dependent FMN reductase